jgi:hypothetical protein
MHERQRLYDFKVKTLIHKVLLSAIRIKHLLGVRAYQRVKVSIEIFLITKGLLGIVLCFRPQDTTQTLGFLPTGTKV